MGHGQGQVLIDEGAPPFTNQSPNIPQNRLIHRYDFPPFQLFWEERECFDIQFLIIAIFTESVRCDHHGANRGCWSSSGVLVSGKIIM